MSTMTRGLSDQSEETHDGTGCVVVGVAILLVAALIAVTVAWRSAVDTLQVRDTEIAALKEKNAQLKAQIPQCDQYANDVDTINGLMKNHQYGAAAQLANLDVARIPAPPCGELRRAFAGLAYQAAKAELFENQKGLDGHTASLRRREIEHQADVNDVPQEARFDPWTICTGAYGNQWWELSREACRESFNSKKDVPPSVEWYTFYFDILRNWGWELATRGEATKQQGGTLLHTACKISEAYQLKKDEACLDLVTFFGADKSKWPPPDLSDPVLQAATALKK